MPSGNLIATAEWTGRKGLVSNQMAHDPDPSTFVVYTDIINDQQGRRRKRPGIGTPVAMAQAAAEITHMHEFVKTDSSGNVTYYKFRTYGAVIQRWDGAAWNTSPLGAISFTGTNWQFCSSRNRCFAINGVDGLFFFDGTTGPDGREWFTVGIATPTTNIGYSLSAADAPYSTGSVSVTKGTKAVTGSGATTWVTSGAWSGKFIDIAGVRYTIATVTVASPGQLTLVEDYRGTTASGVLYTIYIGLMDWSEPPQYAFGYKNSTSGHVSNVSPPLQITEKDRVGRTPRLTGIPYSPTDFNNGYDKIQIYRTAKNGTVLVAIDPASGGLINNSSGAGTTTFTETANTYRDVNLTKFAAPLVSNRKPLNGTDTAPAAFSSIAEWNGRLFAIAPREGFVYYSASEYEIEFGRAEECWPAKNTLPMTDARGLLRVGRDGDDTLLVQTGGKDRVIVGYNILNFASRELGTKDEGGGLRDAAVSSEGGAFIALYRDKRLVDYAAEMPDLGRDIQDKLSLMPSTYAEKARMVRFSWQQWNLLVLSIPSTGASTANDRTYVFDYDNRSWYEWSVGFTAFMVGHDPTTGALELWASTNRFVFKLLQPNMWQDNGANYTPSMKSAQVRFFGYGKRGLLKWVKTIVNDPAQVWGCRVYVNEDATGELFLLQVPNFKWQSAAGRELIVPAITSSLQRGETFQFEWLWPTISGDLYIEKMIAEPNLDQDVEAVQ